LNSSIHFNKLNVYIGNRFENRRLDYAIHVGQEISPDQLILHGDVRFFQAESMSWGFRHKRYQNRKTGGV
jgi:hypothetical protein